MKKVLLINLWIFLLLAPLAASAETVDFVFEDEIALNSSPHRNDSLPNRWRYG
jgi:hypothetical protein